MFIASTLLGKFQQCLTLKILLSPDCPEQRYLNHEVMKSVCYCGTYSLNIWIIDAVNSFHLGYFFNSDVCGWIIVSGITSN